MMSVVAGGGDEDVGDGGRILHGHHPEPLHGRLQGTDRVDLGHPDGGTQAAQGLGAALAHVAVAADHGDLAGDHDVGGTLDAVHQRLAAAVEVVELGLGDRVVDVHGGEQQGTGLEHLIEAMDAGGGLLGDTLDALGHPGPVLVVALELAGQHAQDGGPLLVVVRGRGRDRAGLLVLHALVDQQGGVAAVVQDHVRATPRRAS